MVGPGAYCAMQTLRCWPGQGRAVCINYRRTKVYAAMRDEISHMRLPIRVPTSEAAPNLEPQGEIRPTQQAIMFALSLTASNS